ncbi:MAG: prepilin-type N-terminal cleavage/methylation domain-containing protein [Phycisphaerae bacterium]
MKTEKKYSRKGTKALKENRNIYFKTSCLSGLVAKAGFTLVEVLTTLTIIAILIGILLPALGQVKKFAIEARQKAQISSIDIAANLYKNDFGEYPPSHGSSFDPLPANDGINYCGAQTLAEALVGYDLLGVHRNSVFKANGYDSNSPTPVNLYPSNPDAVNLSKRKGPYLDRTNIGVFKPKDIFANLTDLKYPDNYVICDAFAVVSKKIGGKTYKIGTPVLYFRANPSPVNMQLISSTTVDSHLNNIYNYFDNYPTILTGINNKKPHKLYESTPNGSTFYNFIRDTMIPIVTPPANSCGRPVRPDSFILISAGSDGLYGTNDDICNFEPNFE